MAIFTDNDKTHFSLAISELFDHIHFRKASFDGGSSYRNRQANVCYDAQVREYCYEHAARG